MSRRRGRDLAGSRWPGRRNARLGRAPPPEGPPSEVGRELPAGPARVVAALLSGTLGWIDFLLIGRDREAHTRLFYVLRELRRSGAAPALPPVAFFDLLRLPTRTSARYNRLRAAELAGTIATWAGRPIETADLTGAAEATRATARSIGAIQALRIQPRSAITGAEALAAAVAARILPGHRLDPLLDAALVSATPGHSPRAPGHRVFLAGSGVDDPAVYESLERLGLAIVGEDHEWGDDGSEAPAATLDPLDGIVDRYHFAHGGAARAGVDRAAGTAARVRAAGADGVLYVLGADDEAAGWELPQLRARLGGEVPLIPARRHGTADQAAELP